jgi:hypothetical protein
MLREVTYPPAAVNVLDVSSESMAAFQVFMYGRFWVFTEEIIAQQKKLFREQFGREPGPDDPLFFESSVAVPQFLSDESTDEIWKSLLQAAGDSGIDPAIVYAMNKTGRMVTKTNVHFLTDAELQEWNDAVDEYQQKVEAGETQ